MEKLISKIKNKRLNGNISLLVILILLASSVIALLSINQIQNLITYWNTTFNYFRAFYLAKAGTELWLTEVYNREAWFEDEIENTQNKDGTIVFHDIIKKNFMADDKEYGLFSPYFTMKIESNFKNLTNDVRFTENCDDDNKIILYPWDGIMLSLFKDDTKRMDKILNPDYSDLSPLSDDQIKSLGFWNPKWDFTFWIFAYDKNWNMTDIIVRKSNDSNASDLNKFLNNNLVVGDRRYLTIKNSWTDSVEFCINSNKKNFEIPYTHSLITVRGYYWDMEVWLESIVKKWVPSWTLNVLDEVSSSN